MTVPLRRVGAAALAAAALAATAACGGAPAGGDADDQVTLVVRTFGNFGFAELIREYGDAHPGVRVVEEVREFQEHHETLRTALDAGGDAGDVVAVDESFVVEFRSRPDDFQNLLDLGAGAHRDDWLPWKWEQSLSADGSFQLGLGTDVGGLAMCYRPDLFRAAGLPTDRDAVARLWPTWEAYLATGRRFAAADLPASWTDSASNTFNAVLGQQPVGYYRSDDTYLGGNSAGVQRAWTVASAVATTAASARLVAFTAQWTAALQAGRFATLPCPAWMLGWIQSNAPAARGTWDVTAIPGGAGNWGGSFLTVPAAGAHPDEAYELARWLTATPQQRRVFVETGNLPSHPALYRDPAVVDLRNGFFSGAPVGEIFTASAQQKRPQYQGLRSGLLRTPFEEALVRVETGERPVAGAWRDATREADRIAAS